MLRDHWSTGDIDKRHSSSRWQMLKSGYYDAAVLKVDGPFKPRGGVLSPLPLTSFPT